jgi:hypothetical protein
MFRQMMWFLPNKTSIITNANKSHRRIKDGGGPYGISLLGTDCS